MFTCKSNLKSFVYLFLIDKKSFASPRKPLLWRLFKTITIFSFLVECEGILQFIYVSRDIEYQVEALSEQQEIYAFVLLGVVRWSVTLFAISHLSLALEEVSWELIASGNASSGKDGGGLVTGHGLSINRLRLNLIFGWATQVNTTAERKGFCLSNLPLSLQIGCDYFLLHYLLYMTFYCASSPLYALQSDDYYHFPEKGPASFQILFSLSLVASCVFYLRAVRKEITFFNFVL